MRTAMITTEDTYRGLDIQCGPGLECRVDILERLHHLLTKMLTRHSKVFFLRFDVRFPCDSNQYGSDNDILQRFIDSFVKSLRRKYLDPCYLWVREQKTHDSAYHYHFCLLMNGHRTQSIYGHLKTAERLWARAVAVPDGTGLIDYCITDKYGHPQQNGVTIRRNSADFQESFSLCFHWGSYLAKTNTKGLAPSNIREWGSSRV